MGKNDQRSRISAEIEKDFESTVLQDLMPGLLHCFANPLNGILGRSRLLQERVEKTIEAVKSHHHTGNAILDGCTGIARDADLIVRESEIFFDLFGKISRKIYRLSDATVQQINLSDLVQAEVEFLDFYLDFRHTIDKKLFLNRDVPEVEGTYSWYSLSLFELIRRSGEAMKGSEGGELVVVTDYDDSYVYIDIKDTAPSLSKARITRLMAALEGEGPASGNLGKDRGFFNALFLLKGYRGGVKIGREEQYNVVKICIPYKNNRIPSTKRRGMKKGPFPEAFTLL